MKLSTRKVSAQIAVSDIDRAVRFYEGTLGLVPTQTPSEQTRAYPCGDGTVLHVYASPDHAGMATSTVARWDVDDIVRAVEELTASGVTFEKHDEPVATDDRGIHDSGYGKVAWFRDPDGNTFALEQV